MPGAGMVAPQEIGNRFVLLDCATELGCQGTCAQTPSPTAALPRRQSSGRGMYDIVVAETSLSLSLSLSLALWLLLLIFPHHQCLPCFAYRSAAS